MLTWHTQMGRALQASRHNFSKIRDMPSPHFWYMILHILNYLNPWWSGARAWALYVIFGLDHCHSAVPELQYHHLEGLFSKIRNMPSPHLWYLLQYDMYYVNAFWSGARAWARCVIFGLDWLGHTVVLCTSSFVTTRIFWSLCYFFCICSIDTNL
jgi:hypothetical protein